MTKKKLIIILRRIYNVNLNGPISINIQREIKDICEEEDISIGYILMEESVFNQFIDKFEKISNGKFNNLPSEETL